MFWVSYDIIDSKQMVFSLWVTEKRLNNYDELYFVRLYHERIPDQVEFRGSDNGV
jgi:aspartate carbamoyltransferase catalytic subunit